MTTLQTKIPFSGFCDSFHGECIDDTLYYMLADDRGEVDDDLLEKARSVLRVEHFQTAYAKAYAEAFADNFGFEIEFSKLTSPGEYNFETDKIHCTVKLDDVKSILSSIDLAEFRKYVFEQCSHRGGFFSFYPANLEEWPIVADWDCNHVGILLGFIVKEEWADSQHIEEWELMDSHACSGSFEEWLFDDPNNSELLALVNSVNAAMV